MLLYIVHLVRYLGPTNSIAIRQKDNYKNKKISTEVNYLNEINKIIITSVM